MAKQFSLTLVGKSENSHVILFHHKMGVKHAGLLLLEMGVGLNGDVDEVTDSVGFNHGVGRVPFNQFSFDEFVHILKFLP
jgi:hypothetical protein